MSRILVEAVTTRRQQKDFFRFPWDLYRADPNWIPPLRQNQQELLGFKSHPFHDEATVQPLVAYQDGKVCGRIAAIVHRGHNQRYQEQRGFFGFLETIDDEDVAGRLFDAAFGWLRSQGMNCVRGPMNPGFHYEIGMLVEGFEYPPTFMMTYNPAYYGRLLERLGGFEKAQDLYAFYGHIDMVPQLLEKIGRVVKVANDRFQFSLRPIDTSRFRQEIQLFLEIYNKSFQSHWGFVPMSEGEVARISSELRHLIVPELTVMAEVEGKPVGCMFAIPDYNPRIRQIDGRLFPFGFARLLWNRRAIKRARLVSANVIPEYQMWGLGMAMLDYLVPIAQRRGIQDAEFSWVAESNKLSRLTLENGGATREKIYRIFDRQIV